MSIELEEPQELLYTLDNGVTIINLRYAKAGARDSFNEVLSEILGYHESRRYSLRFPVEVLVPNRDALVNELEDNGIDITKGDLKKIIEAIDAKVTEIHAQLANKLSRGLIEWDDLPYIYTKGKEVVANFDNHPVGGTVAEIRKVSGWAGTYYNVKMNVISNVHGQVSDQAFNTRIYYFNGLKPLAKLNVHPITTDETEFLTERGRKFRDMTAGVQYLTYHGQMTRNSWFGSQTFRADGRIMLDVGSFSRVDNNQYDSEGRASGIESGHDHDQSAKEDMTIEEADLWRTYPFVYGFSFAAKMWGRLNLSDVSYIKFREDAFEKLVLPEEDKSLVRAIVEDDGNDFSDLIDGKGGGSIFLLHGPPGQGKTLTAEAIAEVLKRPLYSISVGELGTSPETLERTLREILDVATIWNAVLLLDEADIFLEERDEKDIVRNAMVGVFLRLLEYHQGVLFLTTNRVKNIDKAFYSRISIGLRFGEADHAKRKAIWTNLTASAGVNGLDLEALAEHDLNGRQIKNVIRLAVKLARSQQEQVSDALVNNVIARTGNFTNEVAVDKNHR